jgi:hypothetical protein
MKHCGRVDPCLPLRIARTHPTSLQSLFQCRACNCTCDLTVAPYLRRETNAELQATNIYNKPGDDPGAPDAASGTGAG